MATKPSKISSKLLRQWAEQEAMRILECSGFNIQHQNYHSRFGEVDIIADKDQELIFVEVKARSPTKYGLATEVVTEAKQIKIIKTAMCFLEKNPQFQEFYCRFDIICFDFHQEIAKNVQQDFSKYPYDQQWIENAFTLDAELFNL